MDHPTVVARRLADLKNYRSKCLRLGTFAVGLEANIGPTTNQSRSYVCSLVAVREEIRSWLGGPGDSGLLL